MIGKSLRTRMVLYTVFTTGLALLLAGVGLIIYDSTFMRDQVQEQLINESELVRRVCGPAILFQDHDTAREIVGAVGLDRDMDSVVVYLADGQILAAHGKPALDLKLPAVVGDGRAQTAFNGKFATVLQPVLNKGRLEGWVYLKRDFSRIAERHKKYFGILAVILALSLLLTLASSTWLQSGFVKPVRDLVNTANRVSLEKDYSLRTTKTTEDELGQLTDAFNLMLEKVQRRDLDLQYSERRLYQVIDLVPHLIFAKDRSGRFILCNRALARAYGTTVPRILASTHMDMHTGDEAEALQMLEDDHRVMDAGEQLMLEETFTGPDGTLRILRTTKIPFSQSGTAEDAILGIAIDITKEKQADQELREAHEDLKQANDSLERRVEERTAEVFQYQQRLIRQEKLAAIGQISGSIAHELRNPLGAMKQSIFFLRRYLAKSGVGGQHPKFEEHLQILDEELSASDHVISSLLDMTRVRKVERIQVELEGMLDEVQSRCSIRAPMEFNSDLQPHPFLLLADPVQLRQVLVNLVQNACDACPENGAIQVTGRIDAEAGVCRIELSDNGCGMEEQTVQRIFEPLYTTKAKGTGLGLSICRQIIEEHHGGRISVQSKMGEGTRFDIELPLDKPPPQQ